MKLMSFGLRLIVLVFLGWSPALAQGQLWVVDDNGGAGVDFTDIQSAVDAASDGDTVLVHDGNYCCLSVTIDGKALLLAVAQGGTASMGSGKLFVRNLTAGREVMVRGLSPGGVELTANEGTVLLEDVRVGNAGPLCASYNPTGHGLSTDGCAAVVATRCTFGAAGFLASLGAAPFNGIKAKNSSLYLYETVAAGANPYDEGTTPGGVGVNLSGSFLFASGCTFYGGCGSSTFEACVAGGAGGIGLLNLGPNSYLLETEVIGGLGVCAGFYPLCGTCPPDGADIVGGSITVAGFARDYEIDSPGNGGSTTTLHYAGKPGDLVFSVVGLTASPLFLLDLAGALVPAIPPLVISHGAVDGTGQLAAVIALPPLPPGVGAFKVHAQGAAISAVGAAVLGSPTHLTIL